MFTKIVDTNNRDEMITFLKNHFRYHTMNPWNNSTSYANNVKLYNLNIPEDKFNLAFEIITGEIECTDYQIQMNNILHQFTEDTGYIISTNGRSGGYLVMYDTEFNTNTGTHMVMPGRNIDMYENFEEWSDFELQERVHIVTQFDKACSELCQMLIDILNTYVEHVEETTKTIVVTHRTLIAPKPES